MRTAIPRRFASTEHAEHGTKLVGPMDNAFNRERLAVREHAAQSAGNVSLPRRSYKIRGIPGGRVQPGGLKLT